MKAKQSKTTLINSGRAEAPFGSHEIPLRGLSQPRSTCKPVRREGLDITLLKSSESSIVPVHVLSETGYGLIVLTAEPEQNTSWIESEMCVGMDCGSSSSRCSYTVLPFPPDIQSYERDCSRTLAARIIGL